VATTFAAPAASNAFLLAEVRVTAIGVAPMRLAIWIAASPTLLEAAVMMTASSLRNLAISIRAP